MKYKFWDWNGNIGSWPGCRPSWFCFKAISEPWWRAMTPQNIQINIVGTNPWLKNIFKNLHGPLQPVPDPGLEPVLGLHGHGHHGHGSGHSKPWSSIIYIPIIPPPSTKKNNWAWTCPGSGRRSWRSTPWPCPSPRCAVKKLPPKWNQFLPIFGFETQQSWFHNFC